MLRVRFVLKIIFLNFFVAAAYASESLYVPDITDVLKFEKFENVSETCENHLKMYLNDIRLGKMWALKMIDSIPKIPDGVLFGHLVIPGFFDECVSSTNEFFSGKYCLTKLEIQSQKEIIRLPKVYSKKDDDSGISFTYGICIPSTCNATEINSLFNALKLEAIKVELTEDCSVAGYRSLRTEDWITVGVIIFICVIAIGSTGYELYQKYKLNNEKPNELWSSFSIYKNWKSLFSISQSTSQLKCLHGIRFLSMSWVILCHCYFLFLLSAPMNPIETGEYLKDKSFIPVSNGFVSVDSFFFLSGLLVCLVFFRSISKKKTFDVPVAYIHRYIRLTPPFALLTLIQATIISRIGNGPFWNERSDAVEKGCRESWWVGLLYIQNYLKPTSMCLGQAWYLSADMQMFWISPLILYPVLYFPSFAPYLMLILVLIAALINFTIAFVNELGPSLITNIEIFKISQFELEYVTFHTRMAPWLIGLATGYILCGIQAKKIRLKLSTVTAVTGWIAALSLLGGSIFGISKFIANKYSPLEAAFYLAFHRVGWGLGLAWVVIACVGGYGGPINTLLSLDIFQPLGKLSYCNFLIHMTLQNYRANSARTNYYIRHLEVVYAYFGDLLISNILSIPVVLLFEFPFSNIDRHFFQKLQIFPWPRPEKKKNKDEEDINSKSKESCKKSDSVEEGKINPTFIESV